MRIVLLVVLTVLSLGFVLAPGVLVMSTGRAHSPRDLEWAYLLTSWSPWVTGALALAGLILAWSLARRVPSIPTRAASGFLVVVLGAASWFSFTRPAENVFAPVTRVSFVPAGEVDFLEPDDMVLGVRIDHVARAYPVGQLLYHHIANDVVAGVPIVATF